MKNKSNNFLKDKDFLKKIDLQRVKEQFIKIIVLDWEENPIQDLTGQVLSGSINIDGQSSIRRTANLSIFIPNVKNDITNPDNLLSINKKISIEIGIVNKTNEYLDIPIIWFPLGVYVINSIGISHTLQGTTVSLNLKDKMCLLNGECGGMIPASVNFSEIETVDENGQTFIDRPTLFQIIQETVHHWGGEQLGKIFINDLDSKIKKVMKWVGSVPLYCYNKGNGYEFTTNSQDVIGLKEESNPDTVIRTKNTYIKYSYGYDIGYIYTDFIYPSGELIGNAGSSVCDVLDSIKNLLGNYEYFYDLDGNFVFQEIKNYLNTSKSTVVLNELKDIDYIVDQSNGKKCYDFNDSTLITAYSNSPQLNMIKNDFIVWGQKETATGKKLPIRFHLAIDEKPLLDNAEKIMIFPYKDSQDNIIKAKKVIECTQKPAIGEIGFFYLENNIIWEWIFSKEENKMGYKQQGTRADIKEITIKDWRTQLYLEGVLADPYGYDSNPYYTELVNEWPKLYDIYGENPNFKENYLKNPSDCDYFLDFIDSSAEIGKFSIKNIGKRTKVVVDDKINCIFAPSIPDIVLIEAGKEDSIEKEVECQKRGANFSQVDSSIYSQIAGGGVLNSAYDEIKNLLYQYTSYNESISLQCLPVYYLDVNTRIGVNDPESNIFGDYMINSISFSFDVSSVMSISAVKTLEKI